MKFSTSVPLPQGRGLQNRVEANISNTTGRLEDLNLDLDARTMAILGKRQELRVSRSAVIHQRSVTDFSSL